MLHKLLCLLGLHRWKPVEHEPNYIVHVKRSHDGIERFARNPDFTQHWACSRCGKTAANTWPGFS